MEKKLKILRRKSSQDPPYWQTFSFSFTGENETVATALAHLDQQEPLLDEKGCPGEPIRWQCSCLQKKCGACAMRVNGVPRLACQVKLADCKQETIQLEPLKKFPVVADLIVDRQVMFDRLTDLQVWFTEETRADRQNLPDVYEASKCLQCGCCLEICPNFSAGGKFVGMAAGVSLSRLLAELPQSQRDTLCRTYRRAIYEGCGKSLACGEICPAGIDTEHLLSRSNAVAVWGRYL